MCLLGGEVRNLLLLLILSFQHFQQGGLRGWIWCVVFCEEVYLYDIMMCVSTMNCLHKFVIVGRASEYK